jgi:hypothetical protein
MPHSSRSKEDEDQTRKVDALLMELFPEKYSKIKPKAKKTAAKYKQQQLKEQQREAQQQLQQHQQQQPSHHSHHPSSYPHNSHQVILLYSILLCQSALLSTLLSL